jgi:hypothetical protein
MVRTHTKLNRFIIWGKEFTVVTLSRTYVLLVVFSESFYHGVVAAVFLLVELRLDLLHHVAVEYLDPIGNQLAL